MSKRDAILLLASPNEGARTFEGGVVQGEEDGRFRYMGGTLQKNEQVDIGRDMS
jgi:hypothetical protein